MLSGGVGHNSPAPVGDHAPVAPIAIVATSHAPEKVAGTPGSVLNHGGGANGSGGGGTTTVPSSATAIRLQVALVAGNAAKLTSSSPGAAGPIATASSGINYLTSDERFVDRLYEVFLHRGGSLQDLNFWAQQIPSLGRGGVAYDIAHSPEALSDDVTLLYWGILGRAPDPWGLASWTQSMEGGATIEQVEAHLLASPEFQQRANALVGTANPSVNYVYALYEVMLGRAPDAGGLSYWVNALPSVGAYQVAYYIATSAEYRTDVVGMFYQIELFRTGVSWEIAIWVNSGLDLLSIAVGIASSQEFYNDGIYA
jgi:hypothetical protein